MTKKTDMHMASVAHSELHFEVSENTEGGKCLTGHSYSYDDKKSCTYRWQALQAAAKERHKLYQRAKGKTKADRARGFVKTSRYLSLAGNPHPAGYAWRILLPQKPGDWAVGGPRRNDMRKPGIVGKVRAGDEEKCIAPGTNYTKSYIPYWNNAHHLIPKGTLKAEINELSKKDFDLREFVIGGLLNAEYNVNHWINVILLPMDREVGRLLKLPRHLILEDETLVVGMTEKFDHTAYGDMVGKKLVTIVENFEEEFSKWKKKKKKKKCEAWKTAKLSKKRLVSLSKKCYKRLVAFGKSTKGAGAPLSDLPPW